MKKNYGAIRDILTNFPPSNNNNDAEDEKYEDRIVTPNKAEEVLKEGKKQQRYRQSSSTRRIVFRAVLVPSLLIFFWISSIVFSHHTKIFRSSSTSSSQNMKKKQITTHPMSFDYIVVGAGPSGIVTAVNLARRLQQREEKLQLENENRTTTTSKVLLLESGALSQSSVLKALQNISKRGDNYNTENLYKGKYADPLLLHDLDVTESVFTDSSLDLNKFDVPYYWNELSKQKSEQDTMNYTNSFYSLHHWPIDQTFLGRAVGGSGVHNAMINVRALPSDFDRWNVTNWTPEIMMPYFERMESYDESNNEVPFWTNSPDSYLNTVKKYRGHNGPLNVQQAGSIKMKLDPVAKAFLSSASAAGIPLASMGFNDRDEEMRMGAGLYEFNIRNGLRDSVASALLSGDRDGYEIPENLVIWTSCTVHKILFDTTSKPKAVGLLYDSRDKNDIHKVMLKGSMDHVTTPEIILAAGAVLTPQLLSNSGIRDGGIISNLSGVGKNLQDHPVVAVAYEESQSLEEDVNRSTIPDVESKMNYLDALKYWKTHSTQEKNQISSVSKKLGILGTASFAAGAFLASPWSVDGNPDIQLTVFPRTQEPHSYSELLRNKKYSQSMKNVLLITVALLRPEGRRTIGMAPYSDDSGFSLPTLHPRDNLQYLTDFDIQRISWGIKQVRKIMSHSPLANETEGEVFPGSQISNDKDLKDFVIRESMTNSHWCGSAKMGTAKDSVVDETLKVHGVDSLRVVDAGVMPFIPNGNTHSTTCAVALRAVDLILGQ